MLNLTNPVPGNPDDAQEAMPLPTDPKVIYLAGLFFLALAAALYVAAEIAWPLVFAFMLSLLFKPVQRLLARIHLPRLVSACLIVLTVLGLVVGLGTTVSGPAATWATKLPDGIPRLLERLRVLEGPLSTLQNYWHQIEVFAGWQEGASTSVGTALLGHLFPALAISRAASLRHCCFFFFFSLLVRRFFNAWWKSCLASVASGK
jgi:predicted PurR-regulated permease PerM